MNDDIEAAARQLYEWNDNRVKPAWEQLGERTKDVWREYVATRPMPPRPDWVQS